MTININIFYFHPPLTKLAHKYLRNYEDTDSPIGEVFSCTIEIAIQAIEDALKDLKLFNEATVLVLRANF